MQKRVCVGVIIIVALAVVWVGPAAALEMANDAEHLLPPSELKVITAGALVDTTYVGSDVTPTVSVTAAETGGTVTLYLDPACSEIISAPIRVTDTDEPFTVDIGVVTELAVGLHHIHAMHTKSSQHSECSSEVATYQMVPPMTASYRVTFVGVFTTDVLAPDVSVPGGAHFTTLIGGVHNTGVIFWERGSLASAGTELMAETGRTGTMRLEVAEAHPDASEIIEEALPRGSTPTAVFEITVSGEHASVTLASMVAPTPDWFVGVSSWPMLEPDGSWVHYDRVELFPYDAGTEDGYEFSLSNDDTMPPEIIASLRDTGKFAGDPIVTLQFERIALVSNLGQESGPGAIFVGHNPDAATQGFHTGPNPDGYILHSVTASFGDKAGTPGDLQASIVSDDDGSPGDTMGILHGDNPGGAGMYTFAADEGIPLDADTTYYVVFEVDDPLPGSAYRLMFTGSDIEDSGAASGWSIADTLQGHVHDIYQNNSWKISVQGEAVIPLDR